MCARVRVVPPGLTGTNPGDLDDNGNPVDEIPIDTGDVKFDSTADIRSTVDLTTSFGFPADADGLLTPYGNELFVERGVYVGGERVFVSQGYFRIYSVDQDTAPDGEVVIAARDRMSGIIDAQREQPFQFGEGTSIGAVFDFLVGEVYPSAVIDYDFDEGATLFTTSHIIESDRYTFLKDIADSLGKVMYWDYRGHLQVVTAPDPTSPVFSVDHGDGGVAISVSRSLNREGAFNAFIVVGEQAGETLPVRAVAYDLNPASPTMWGGPFGKVPTKTTSSFVTTAVQAQAAADAQRDRSIGVPYEIDFSMVPLPALEPLDPVLVSFSDQRPAEVHVLQTLTIPLNAEAAMTGTTRQRIFGGNS